MIDKKKILFVNDEMEMGGVARVLNNLMSSLPKDKYDISLLVLHKRGLMLDEIPSYVRVYEASYFFSAVDISLKLLLKSFDVKNLFNKIRLIFYMKTGLIKSRIKKERYNIFKDEVFDVEFAAKEGFCTIFTAFGNSKRKVNWVLNDYSKENFSKNHMKLLAEALEHIDLNIADSKQAKDSYMSVFNINNAVYIHNLMDEDRVRKNIGSDVSISDGINIINVARFHPQKSLDRLILAHKYVLDKGIKHNLYLVGGGSEEEKLKDLCKSLNLDSVHFMGYLKDPYPLINKCDLFVLSSLYEGFATIVNESLISGTPVLSTKVAGIEEQINNDDYGWIIDNDLDSLKEGLYSALSDLNRLYEMKNKLKEYKYPNDEILNKFMEVL